MRIDTLALAIETQAPDVYNVVCVLRTEDSLDRADFTSEVTDTNGKHKITIIYVCGTEENPTMHLYEDNTQVIDNGIAFAAMDVYPEDFINFDYDSRLITVKGERIIPMFNVTAVTRGDQRLEMADFISFMHIFNAEPKDILEALTRIANDGVQSTSHTIH